MACEVELERMKAALLKLRDLGIDPLTPGADIRDKAKAGTLTRQEFDAYLEREIARSELSRCVREAFERGEL